MVDTPERVKMTIASLHKLSDAEVLSDEYQAAVDNAIELLEET